MNWLKKYFYLLPVFLYLPALINFFSGDDWFHLRISQISSLPEFLNFFTFTQSAQSASFYRPLSTQVFFFTLQKLFGLTAWPYYLFGLLLFAYSLHLVYLFSKKYLPSTIYHLPSLIYGISVSNFTRVYFLSAYQELFLVIFSLLTLLNFSKKPASSLLFFVLALLSKETAIVLPLLILILNTKDFKSLKFYLPAGMAMIFISVIYLYFRLFHFGLVVGDSYLWNFSPVKALNTLMWYLLWTFGAPELLIDYVGSGLKLVPKFFVDYSTWWRLIIFPLAGTIVSAVVLGLQKIKHLNWNLVKFIFFFLITLLPVLFLPSHKFSLELGLPLVGFSLALSWLLPQKIKSPLSIIFLSFYLFLNLSMNYLTYTRHYSVSRGEISKKVYDYFKARSSQNPSAYFFEFKNDSVDYGEQWGQSKQISQALSGSDFFKVYYQDNTVEVFYEDYNNLRPIDKKEIPLSSEQFLKSK